MLHMEEIPRATSGPKKLYTAQMKIFCTPEMKAEVNALSVRLGRTVPELLRGFVRVGLAMESEGDDE